MQSSDVITENSFQSKLYIKNVVSFFIFPRVAPKSIYSLEEPNSCAFLFLGHLIFLSFVKISVLANGITVFITKPTSNRRRPKEEEEKNARQLLKMTKNELLELPEKWSIITKHPKPIIS